ncbi:MAG: hypothetical protein HOI23_08695 [Deltaproteobacteria bacterium]|jgi:hypothetical protein|nr:hypothetical protein [Deltaproteobacteria bacterium]MBT6431708.1 hypothetical protein [Deltaproteobacteria bacterium]
MMKSFSACPACCVFMTVVALVAAGHLVACAEAGTGHDTQIGSSDSANPSASDDVDSLNEESASSDVNDCTSCGEHQSCVDDACVCDEGFQDCDGLAENGCETQGECSCETGSQRPCYHGPVVTQNVGACVGGVETCVGTGWSACAGQVLPTEELCEPNGIDEDCDGELDETQDVDGDGWSVCDGDCCDDPATHCALAPALVNPGAFDVAGNGLDDDCDGTTDNEVASDCSSMMITEAVTGEDLMMAMDLCQFTEGHPDIWGVMDVELTQASGEGSPLDYQSGVLEGLGEGRMPPMSHTTLAVLSSGDARGVGDPGYTSNMSDGDSQDLGPAGYLEAHNYALETTDACPVSQSTFHDTVQLSARIRVPTNAQGIKFQFRFFTYEFPLYLCTQFNDFFLALLSSEHPAIPDDKNISFDAAGNPVSVNNAFFTTCNALTCGDPMTSYLLAPDLDQDGCADSLSCNMETNQCETALGACPDGSQDLQAFTENISDAGATGWLTTTAPVVPGEEITLSFHIWDTGDSAYDSLVVIDNFQWLLEPTELITKN